MSDETMAKGAVGDFLRGVGKKVGLYNANEGGLTTDREGHEEHAAAQQKHGSRAGTPEAKAAHAALASGHTHMSLAAHAYEQGNLTLARRHANMAAQYHSSAAGQHAQTAATHGKALGAAVNAMAAHVPGIHVSRAPTSAPAPKSSAGAAAPVKPDYQHLAAQHTQAARSVTPRGEPSGSGVRTHNAATALSQAHTHAASAAGALHAGNARAAATHIENARSALGRAHTHDPALAARHAGTLNGTLDALHAHTGSPMAKADTDNGNRFQALAEASLMSFARR